MSQSQHTAFKELPLVDISGLFSENFNQRKNTANQLDKAAREAGFLYITGHGIPEQSIETIKQCAKSFFALPESVKQETYIGNSTNHSGYVPMGEERFYNSNKIDAKESFDIGFDLDDLSFARPMLGKNQWPEITNFKHVVKTYYDQILELSKVLFRGFAIALNLPEDTFSQYLHRPANQLRMIHYFNSNDNEVDQQGIGAHTDYEFFTILLPTSPGLQVLNGAGQWIDAPILPGAFVMNIGDMMEIITNGQYVATTHRVKRVMEERYSFPMFCNLDYDTLVQPLPELCPEAVSRYKPVVCGEHLFAQTIQTFQYLQKRVANGEIALPKDSLNLSSFGHGLNIPSPPPVSRGH